MPDKCRCGERLHAVHGRDEVYLACPTHGRDWRWQPCPEKLWRSPDISQEPLRSCLAVGEPRYVTPATCASCPIPEQNRKAGLWDACGEALVKGVRLARDRGFLSDPRSWEPGDRRIWEAALAALPEEEDGE